MLIFFVWIRGSFQRSKYIFPVFKAITFLFSIVFFQVLALVRGQELTKTGHKQVLPNLFFLFVDAAVLQLQSQSLDDPHRIKRRYFDLPTAVKS